MKQKVICRLTSGLGNQLFQYSFARYLATTYNFDLEFDLSWFEYFQVHEPKRRFQLATLGLEGSTSLTPFPKCFFLGASGLNCQMAKRFAHPILGCFGISLLREATQYTIPNLSWIGNAATDLYLVGYWQFSQHTRTTATGISNDIYKNFKISSAARKYLDVIESKNAVFIHVRRGDYLQWNLATLERDYYSKALNVINFHISDPHFFVFSDDLDWCKENFSDLKSTTFVDYVSSHRDIDDLLLMSMCDAGIIANSSYSWWAARIGIFDKLIVAPKFWWGTEDSHFADLFLDTWHLI